jgi:hypothetical protein
MKIDWLAVIVFIVGAVMYAIYGAEDLYRRFAMRRMAREFGFACRGELLPEALSLYGTPFNHRRFTWNVMEGERNRTRVVLFDCQIGEGPGHVRRTVMALRVGPDISGTVQSNPGMKVLGSGGWAVISYPEESKIGLTPVGELRGWLRSLQR